MRSSLVRSLVQPLAISSVLGANIINTCTQTLPICVVPLVCESKFHTHIKTGKVIISYILFFKFHRGNE